MTCGFTARPHGIRFFQRAVNQQGLELMRRYISRGHLVNSDIDDVRASIPTRPNPSGRAGPRRRPWLPMLSP
jgi:hypothetical protein